MTRLFRWVGYLAIACMVGGCAATTRQTVLQPLTVSLKSAAHIVVDVASNGPVTAAEAESFASQVVAKLDATGKFSDVARKGSMIGSEDLLVKCEVSDIRRVTTAARALVGAMAGRASMDVHVTLIEPASGKTVGEANVSGVSSGGTIFAGTTEQAIEKAAEAVADYVASQP